MQISREKNKKLLFRAGIFLVAFSLLLFFLIFYPIIKAELRFLFSTKKENLEISLDDKARKNSGDVIVPASLDFSLIIPKIEANVKVLADVNPYSRVEYQVALREGVAHAKGTGFPGGGENIFLFAHSSGNFYDTSRTNTIFFLLNKLEKNDKLSLVYKNKIFHYRVMEQKIVSGDAIEYLTKKENGEKLTLMTCWPPGTDYERLIVVAERDLR